MNKIYLLLRRIKRNRFHIYVKLAIFLFILNMLIPAFLLFVNYYHLPPYEIDIQETEITVSPEENLVFYNKGIIISSAYQNRFYTFGGDPADNMFTQLDREEYKIGMRITSFTDNYLIVNEQDIFGTEDIRFSKAGKIGEYWIKNAYENDSGLYITAEDTMNNFKLFLFNTLTGSPEELTYSNDEVNGKFLLDSSGDDNFVVLATDINLPYSNTTVYQYRNDDALTETVPVSVINDSEHVFYRVEPTEENIILIGADVIKVFTKKGNLINTIFLNNAIDCEIVNSSQGVVLYYNYFLTETSNAIRIKNDGSDENILLPQGLNNITEINTYFMAEKEDDGLVIMNKHFIIMKDYNFDRNTAGIYHLDRVKDRAYILADGKLTIVYLKDRRLKG